MTPEEIVASIDAGNRAILEEVGCNLPEVLALMNRAGMQGFKLGSSMTCSMFEGGFAVQAARLNKQV